MQLAHWCSWPKWDSILKNVIKFFLKIFDCPILVRWIWEAYCELFQNCYEQNKKGFLNCFGLNFIWTNKICAITITFSTIFVGSSPKQFGTVKIKVCFLSNLISTYEIESKMAKKTTFYLVMTIDNFFTIRVQNPPKSIWDKIILNFFISFYQIESHFGQLHQGPSCKAHQNYLKNVSRTHL